MTNYLTDIFGGNRKGLHTILVVPVATSDAFITKFNRRIERRIMAGLKAPWIDHVGGINVEEIKCIGCGVTIQTEDPKMEGYAPPASLDKEELICRRCFRLRNYNELQPVSLQVMTF